MESPHTQLELPFRFPLPPPVTRRHIQIATRIVGYDLVRSRRRSLGLTVDHRGLRVGAPRSATLTEIEAFIRANGAWALRKLDEWQREGVPAPIVLGDGACLPVLGQAVRVRVVDGADRARWQASELVLEARGRTDLRVLAERALKQRALEVFSQRIAVLARGLGRQPPPLRLSSAQTRWGSCSERSGIRLNWRLIHLPLALIDYVTAHELAHLEEMNHSPRFWAVVERLYPDYLNARAELRRMASRLPRL